jgi:hypothetical protein
MPLALRDLQAAFTAHIVGGDRPDLIAAVRGDSIPAAARLAVYRHHVLHSLAGALAATFPTVQALVGEAFFRQLAHAFVAGGLPTQPVLAEYGAAFPAFVESRTAAHDLPYLADIARLDWAFNVAFHSPADGRLSTADLAVIPTEELPSKGLALAAGAGLIRSRYPIDRIWTASQPGASEETVDLAEGAASLLVLRRPDDAGFIVLERGEAAFLAALDAGQSLDAAAEAGLADDPAFNLSTTFSRLLRLQAFAAPQQ